MTQGAERSSRDEEGNYSMIHLQNQDALEGRCWNSTVKTALVLFFVVGLCVALILTIIIPLDEGESVHRKYYLSCENVEWSYATQYRNMIKNREFNSEEAADVDQDCDQDNPAPCQITKARYIEYTDETFSELAESDPSLGIMGPVIRAKVGDTITVVLKNQLDDENCGIHVHGLQYKRSQEAEEYTDTYVVDEEAQTKADQTKPLVPPGETYEYLWSVPERSGPAANELTSRAWMYHAPVSASMNPYSGLFGMVVVSGQYSSKEDGSPEDIESEVFVALADLTDEQGSSINDSSIKFTVNGLMYGNNFPISLPSGKTTRWYVASLSLTSPGQSIYWHGNTVSSYHSIIDVLFVPSLSVKAVDMGADNKGVWLFSTTEPTKPGMQALYSVDANE